MKRKIQINTIAYQNKKMCLNCLTKMREDIKSDIKDLKEKIDKITCEGCINYFKAIIKVNIFIDVLCSIKIQKYEDGFDYTEEENEIKTMIKDDLESLLTAIEEMKEEMTDGSYLSKMNNIKELNDLMKDVEEADHR